MVGNLNEWVEDVARAFMGSFFARSTRLGCDARIFIPSRAPTRVYVSVAVNDRLLPSDQRRTQYLDTQ